MMSIIYTIITGLVVGLLARAIKPGSDAMGWIWTILLGMGGAVVGGFLASAVGMGSTLVMQIVFAVIGAIILLFIYELIRKNM